MLIIFEGSGIVNVDGTFATTLENATGVFVGIVVFPGAFSSTLTNATGVFTGTEVIPGAFAATLAPATGVFSGVEAIPGAFATTLANATAVITGVVVLPGALSSTLEDVSAALQGVVTNNIAPPSPPQQEGGAIGIGWAGPSHVTIEDEENKKARLRKFRVRLTPSVIVEGKLAASLADVAMSCRGEVHIPLPTIQLRPLREELEPNIQELLEVLSVVQAIESSFRQFR